VVRERRENTLIKDEEGEEEFEYRREGGEKIAPLWCK